MAVSCLCSGVSFSIGKKFSVKGFWEDIRDSDSTAFIYVGEAARYLLAQPPSPRDKEHNVRVMYGNGLRPDVWRRFQERFGVPEVAEFFNSSEGVFGLLNVCKGTCVYIWNLRCLQR
jgi:acyl-CoA synthetase (AMP-forming)/AMP-acid ligase II